MISSRGPRRPGGASKKKSTPQSVPEMCRFAQNVLDNAVKVCLHQGNALLFIRVVEDLRSRPNFLQTIVRTYMTQLIGSRFAKRFFLDFLHMCKRFPPVLNLGKAAHREFLHFAMHHQDPMLPTRDLFVMARDQPLPPPPAKQFPLSMIAFPKITKRLRIRISESLYHHRPSILRESLEKLAAYPRMDKFVSLFLLEAFHSPFARRFPDSYWDMCRTHRPIVSLKTRSHWAFLLEALDRMQEPGPNHHVSLLRFNKDM